MKLLISIVLTSFILKGFAFAACPPCNCTENSSPSENINYDSELKKVTKEKIEPKVEIISQKLEKIRELQKEINSKLVSLENLEVNSYVLHKKKNFELERIISQISLNIDVNSYSSSSVMERIKTKINLLSKNYNTNMSNQISDYIK